MNREEKKKNREEFQRRIAEWKESGLSQAEYCRRNNLSASKLLYWNKRLSDNNAAHLGFVQLPVSVGTGFAPIRIEIGNRYCVEVGNGYDPGALEHIVGILSRS